MEEADGALVVLASGCDSEDKFNDSRNFSASDKLSFLLLVSLFSLVAMAARNACVCCGVDTCVCVGMGVYKKERESKTRIDFSLSAYTCQDLKLKETLWDRKLSHLGSKMIYATNGNCIQMHLDPKQLVDAIQDGLLVLDRLLHISFSLFLIDYTSHGPIPPLLIQRQMVKKSLLIIRCAD